MNIADRIQSLRKTRGMSQEELADKIGVSRQTISKWESEQSTPDIEKVILLSDFFEVSTDYLLKGIEPIKGEEEIEGKKIDARILSSLGTMVNFIGLTVAIAIWIERQVVSAVAAGLILMALGSLVHFIGQIVGKRKEEANKWFWLINVWIFLLIPLSCLFNIFSGFLGGFSISLSPIPQLGNSLVFYGLFWIFYPLFCVVIDIFLYMKLR